MTRQMPYEPLPASVLLAPGCWQVDGELAFIVDLEELCMGRSLQSLLELAWRLAPRGTEDQCKVAVPGRSRRDANLLLSINAGAKWTDPPRPHDGGSGRLPGRPMISRGSSHGNRLSKAQVWPWRVIQGDVARRAIHPCTVSPLRVHAHDGVTQRLARVMIDNPDVRNDSRNCPGTWNRNESASRKSNAPKKREH
jgi:hypothetical protein